jgi:hypothetical protein
VNAAYSPGLIVADISPVDHLANQSLAPGIKLLPDGMKPLPNGGFLYRLCDDPEWYSRPENNGNIVRFIVDEFSQIDRSRYHVYQCLITLTRQVFKLDDKLFSPKRHLLVVHHSAEMDALTDLARIVYVV